MPLRRLHPTVRSLLQAVSRFVSCPDVTYKPLLYSQPVLAWGKEQSVAAVIHNEMLDEILAQVRPLLGREVSLPITFPRWPRSAVISSASPFVLSTGSVFRRGRRAGAIFHSVDLKVL